MGQSQTFEHTADVGLRVWGDNLDDLFVTAAEGLFDLIVVDRETVERNQVEELSLTADSTEELLAGWLSELIFRSETHHRIYARFSVEVASGGMALKARIEGADTDLAVHVLDHEVKAVTRHGFIVRQEPDGRWFAELILDI